MKRILSVFTPWAALILMALILGACAKPYHLNVRYAMPQQPMDLPGNQVAVSIVDARDSQAIFSETAQREFDRWDGVFVLVTGESPAEGAFKSGDFAGLLKEALKTRLQAMNIDAVDADAGDLPVLELTLNKFYLDLKDRNWVSTFNYEVKLSKDGSKTGREVVNAQAERTKIMGKRGGERLFGEIFSEGINRLNLAKLFENAGF